MEEAFDDLRHETKSKELRSCIETLIKIHRNILQNPTEAKFRFVFNVAVLLTNFAI